MLEGPLQIHLGENFIGMTSVCMWCYCFDLKSQMLRKGNVPLGGFFRLTCRVFNYLNSIFQNITWWNL